MKSVGEALALGRSFGEALNKAFRSLDEGLEGLESLPPGTDAEKLIGLMHPMRLRAVKSLLENGAGIEEISRRSGFYPWFLQQIADQVKLESELRADLGDLLRAVSETHEESSGAELLLRAKRMGLSDAWIARLAGEGWTAGEVRRLRKERGITASYHLVDTCAGEFTARTPYFYSTWGETDEGGALPGERRVLILASGPNRIGQGLEFDTCCTMASAAWRRSGVKTIMVNANPETVSTDYNSSDRLYLEPLGFEDVLSIMEKEKISKVVVQLGGQTPLNLAEELEASGARIIGTTPSAIAGAEGRGTFSDLIRRLGLRQPENRSAGDAPSVRSAAEAIGFPVLLRPSFVLGGRSMFIAYGPEELEGFLSTAPPMSAERPILVDRFLEDAFEYDLDAVSDGASIYIGGIMQHIEAAGVHSGDSAAVFPPWKELPEVHRQMREAALLIARELPVAGFLNIQFAVRDGELFVLEVNPRASRTIPFLSKASGVDLVDLAVRVWNGEMLAETGLTGEDVIGEGRCRVGWAVKEAVFSGERFPDFDPLLGPEMRSTGEVAGFGADFGEAFAKAQIAAGNSLPDAGKGGTVFVSVNRRDRLTILPTVKRLAALGFRIAATRGTAWDLYRNGVMSEVILKVHEGHPNIIDHLRRGMIDLVINTPVGSNARRGDDEIRSEAMRLHIPYTTTTSAAEAAAEAMERLARGGMKPVRLPDFSSVPRVRENCSSHPG
jgi:carbamoyl-phosphate synthase large subunit